MNFLEQLLERIRGQFPAAGADANPILLLAVVTAAGLLVLWLLLRVLRRLFRRGGAGPDEQAGVREEDLSGYPPPPAGEKGLFVEGRPARLRLVVVAPVGKDVTVDVGEIETMLDHVLYGLGDLVRQDKPRVCVWPAQLSNKGFAFLFNRMVRRPEPPGQASRWILVAGQTPARPRSFMLGLAVLTEEPSFVGHLFVPPTQWPIHVRV
jgi:hypothetical protein